VSGATAAPASAVRLADGGMDDIEGMLSSADSAFLTCPRRDRGCVYNQGPDRPDDYDPGWLLSNPTCEFCGCSLVLVPRGDYGGPPDKFHDLDTEGSPVVA
jgi:hypothetical protein